MASCDLTIELEGGRTSYHPGDDVSGTVFVETSGQVRCDALTIGLNWETHGRGNRATGRGQTAELFSGEFREGTSRYGFQFTMPEGPATYNGHYLNIGWFLNAHADVPWKLDPQEEREIRLSAGPGEHQKLNWRRQFRSVPSITRRISAGQTREVTPSPGHRTAGGKHRGRLEQLQALFQFKGLDSLERKFAALTLLLLVLSPFVVLGIFLTSEWDPAILVPIAGLLFFAGKFGVPFVRAYMLTGLFDAINLEISSGQVEAGENVAVRLTFTPTKEVTIHRVVATLTACETVIRGSETDLKTRHHTLVEEEVELMSATRAAAGQQIQVEGQLPIPPDAPPSFQATDNWLSWMITTRMDIEGSPDWVETLEIVVMP